MQKFVKDYLNELTRQKKRHREVVIAVVLLAVLVIGGVAGILERYGIAMTGHAKCGIEEHKHTDACYEEVLICGQKEGGGHTHGEGCYKTETTLSCGQEEGGHTHDESCYETETASVLACGQEEGADHTHDESCYETETSSVLVCGQEEGGGHIHDDSCYTETKLLVCGLKEETSHVHNEACYEMKLICDKEEHRHNDSCYADAQEEPENIEEDPEEWEEQYAEVHWKDAWGEDLVTAAKKQLGYEEKVVILEDGSEKTYTRYGHFADEKYLENWDGAFVNFCMHFAGLEDAGIFTDETDTAEWTSEFEKESEENKDYLTSKEDYAPKAGDLVFLQEDGEEEQMGIVSSYNDETGEVEVIQGNSEGKVEENTYDADDQDITAYVKISELEASYKNLPETEENGLTEEEQAQVDEAIALIEDLPAQEEIEKKFAELEEMEDEEAYEKAYEAYYQELAKQVARARKAYEALSEKQQAAVTNAEKLLQYEWLETATLEEGPVSESKLKVSLLYGDEKDQSVYPDGYSYSTHADMSGFIKLEPKNAEKNLENVIVTLTIPKQYVEKDSVKIREFTTDSPVTKWTIFPVTEDEDNYYVGIEFSAYDKTQTLELPFTLSFLDDVVPDNYQLLVEASVAYKDGNGDPITGTAEPVIYKPEYKKWGIDKFVNSNKLDAFKKDGAEAVVTPKDENGNPYLDESDYVEFQFIVNNLINDNRGMLNDYWDATSVTLTDTLPSYTDKEGKTQIAVFDPEENPGWTLSKDGTTVSKTYTGTESKDVLLKIYNDVLKLRFPNLQFKEVTEEKNGVKNVYEIAELDNTVSLLAIPSNEAKGETRPTAEDPLHFKITTDPSTDGKFTKVAMKGNIYDVENYKTNLYPWRIRLSNDGVQPLEHIQIQDRKIDGENGLGGLNEALKFVKLESDWKDSLPAKSGTITDAVEKVIAYYDGSKEEFYIKKRGEPASERGTTVYVEDPNSMVDSLSNFTVEFAKDKVCDGYDIIFKDDFKLLTKEAVSFKAYTVYRDPEHAVVPKGTDKITYENSARSVNIYNNQDGPVYVFLTVEHSYDMLPVTEELNIKKETWYNNGSQNNKIGDKYFYYIYLTGSLMTPDQKEYGDIRVVDLLPEGIEYVSTTNGWGEFTNKDGVFVDNKGVNKPDIIENYHNSGRTALIYHTTYETLRRRWDEGWNGLISIEVRIRPDAHTGTIRNYAYAVGDNLEEYDGSTGGTEDIYDLDNDGDTDDMIAYSYSDAVIIGSKSIYAEKFIAPAGSDSWTKQGLSLKAGMNFDYLLKVTNETATEHNGLIVYDVLPANGDRAIIDGTGRGTEFPVRLRGPITPPEGYTVYYTASTDVNTKSMSEMVSADIWTTEITDWSAVTAFKLVADEGTKLAGESSFQVRIPVCVPGELGEETMKLLEEKYNDQTSGTMAYLEAINSFGFKTDQAESLKESNTVWARVPFAGFVVKKVNSLNKDVVIKGAEFELTKNDNKEFKQTAVSDENGDLNFRDLTEGTYTLTETGFPNGYSAKEVSLTVAITQNPATMEYEVKFEEPFTGAGTSSDPLLIENEPLYELPSTGGSGTAWYRIGGILLMFMAGMLILYKKKYAGRCQKG